MTEGSLENALLELGFNLQNEGPRFWRARPIYRDSSNNTSLRISKQDGSFIDFSANKKGSFNQLVRLALDLESIEAAAKWVDTRHLSLDDVVRTKPKAEKPFQVKDPYPEKLLRHYNYFVEKRGISQETLEQFECGVDMNGKMNNRFVFVIRDEYGDISGLAGRDLLDSGNRTKWKLMGQKMYWTFPFDQAEQYIKEKRSVILVESVGDMLALWDAGVRNVLVVFGVKLSNKLVSLLLSLDIDEIIISTNNDEEKEKNWGKQAAEAIQKKLLKTFDEDSVKIQLPKNNDWGVTPKDEIQSTFL